MVLVSQYIPTMHSLSQKAINKLIMNLVILMVSAKCKCQCYQCHYLYSLVATVQQRDEVGVVWTRE